MHRDAEFYLPIGPLAALTISSVVLAALTYLLLLYYDVIHNRQLRPALPHYQGLRLGHPTVRAAHRPPGRPHLCIHPLPHARPPPLPLHSSMILTAPAIYHSACKTFQFLYAYKRFLMNYADREATCNDRSVFFTLTLAGMCSLITPFTQVILKIMKQAYTSTKIL